MHYTVETTDGGATNMSTAARICGKCGARIPADAPQGFCSACLLETGLGLLAAEIEELDETPARSSVVRTQPIRMLANFGDYELLEEIGRGGQGVVYRARQKSLNRTVALKVIGLGHWATEAHLKRFRLEAEAAAALDNPGIVPIYEIGERDGSCYFSMKFVEGGQLDKLASQKPIPLPRAAQLVAKLARTVHYAHEHGILHRDIKPGNILLDGDGEPHLTDFGLARLVETESTVTRTMEVLGTPSYMAPEEAAGQIAKLTSATDIYGLGAVLYQLLTGQPPFAGGTTYQTIRMVLETEARKPRLWNPKIDRDIETICLKCLEKDPQRRYPSALALAEDLERWARHEPIRARPANVFTRTRKWIRRNPAIAVSIPTVAALIAAVFTIFWQNVASRNQIGLIPVKSIAVLPFQNLNKEQENDYFADGIQDEILTSLAKIADLKVISRTSVLKYKSGAERNLRDIGKALGVAHVLEGTVQRSADRLRVSAQLIDARNDAHLWAEHYDRDIADVFAIQSEIAQQIAEQLRARLSPEEKAAIGEKPTTDLKAYQLYSEARAILIWNDPGGAEKSVARKVELLEQATQRDSNFALAYCALVKAQCDFYDISLNDPVHLQSAKKALDVVMQIRPDLGEAHRELGRYYLRLGDYSRASEELIIARRTLPNDSEMFRIAGEIDRQRNRWEDALRNLLKAYELDPRNGELVYHTRLTYHMMRRYDEEQQFLDKSAFAREPEYPAWLSLYLAEIKLDQGDPAGAHAILAQSPGEFAPTSEWSIYRFNTALCLRDYDEANQVVAATPPQFGIPRRWNDGIIARSRGDEQKAQQAFLDARNDMEATRANKTRDAFYFASLAKIDAGLGRKEDAIREGRRAVELLPITKDSVRGPARLRDLALVYAWTGERDLAIQQLQILAKIPGGPSYGDLRFNPMWDCLRDDPRFDKMVAELTPKAVNAVP